MSIAATLRFDCALTPDGWQDDVAVVIDADGLIQSVAPAEGQGTRVRGAAIPGVGNLHSHAFQRAMAGRTERAGLSDDSFWTWREAMYGFLARMTPEDAEAVASFAYMEMLEAGFTAVGEFHYVHHQPDGRPYADPAEMLKRHAAAARSTGLGLTMLPVFYAHGGFGGQPPTDGQRRFVSSLDLFARIVEGAQALARTEPGLAVGLAPHSLRAVTPEEARALDQLLPAAPRHIHVSEQTREVADCLAVHGTTPIRLLADTFELDARWCLVHATHATEDELMLMARAGAVAGLCPVTEANLGDGVFPGQRFLAKGGRFGVGSDSNVLIGLADELRQFEYSQRLVERRRNVLAERGGSTGRRLFDAALAGGAQALGRRACGLMPGAPADIVVLDTALPELAGLESDALLDAFVFGMRRNAVRDVYAYGRQVVAEGRHVGRAHIEAGYRKAMQRLTGS
jgi:formimidoylglutamate deiminase